MRLLPVLLLMGLIGVGSIGCDYSTFKMWTSDGPPAGYSQLEFEREKKERLQSFYNSVSITFLAVLILFFLGWFLKDAHAAASSGLHVDQLTYHSSSPRRKRHHSRMAADYSRTNRPRKYEPANDLNTGAPESTPPDCSSENSSDEEVDPNLDSDDCPPPPPPQRDL